MTAEKALAFKFFYMTSDKRTFTIILLIGALVISVAAIFIAAKLQEQPTVIPEEEQAQVPTVAPSNTPSSSTSETCPLTKDTQFWYGCSGDPAPGCNSLQGWINGQDVTNANQAVPLTLAINCFRGTTGTRPWLEAHIIVTKQGSTTPFFDSRVNTGGLGNYWYARDLVISSIGTYTATCKSEVIQGCEDNDTFTITQVQATITPAGTITPTSTVSPTATSAPLQTSTPVPTNTTAPSPTAQIAGSTMPTATPAITQIPATALINDNVDQLLVGFLLIIFGVLLYRKVKISSAEN